MTKSVPLRPVFWTLVIGMAIVAIIVMLTSLNLIYRAAYSAQLSDLEESAKMLANVAEAVAQFDQLNSGHDHPEGARGATMSQISEAVAFQSQRRPTSELTIAYLEGDFIKVMRQSPTGSGIENLTRLPNDGVLAQPQYHALKGETGNGEMIDYQGSRVLAGYAFVPTLKIGLVYKIDLTEVQAPFYRAAGWASLIGIGVLLLGALGFSATIRPLARRTQETERRYALVLDAVQDGVWDWNILTGEDYLSPKWKEILGYTDDELTNVESTFFSLIHPDDTEHTSEEIRLHLEEQKHFSLEKRMRHKDGTYRWVLSRGEAIRDDAGTPVRMVGSITDITDRKLIENALQKSQASLSEAQKIAHIGNWEWDIVKGKLHWSDEIYRIFGLLPQQFNATYEEFLKTVHPEDRYLLEEAVNKALAGKGTYNITHRIVLPTQEIRQVQEQAKVSFNDEGNPIRMVGTVQDITFLKVAEQKITNSLAEKDVLLKEIHHRVKNNLQIISSLLNLQSSQIEDEDIRSLFEESKSRVSAMALIHEKLYQSDNIGEIDFVDYIQSLVDTLVYAFGDRARSVKSTISTEKISLDIDSAIPCALIVNELVSNALKYAFNDKTSTENGSPEIRIEMTRDAETHFTLHVSDNGRGFPEGLDFRNTESLGMQIVTTLTNQLDGTIKLDNKNGTAFTIEFEVAK